MKNLAGKKGILVISVFDGSKLAEGIEKIYSPLSNFVGEFIPEINIDYEKCIFTTEKGYYSHWFRQDEIRDMLEQAGLDILNLTKDPKSLAMYLTAIPHPS